MRGVRVGAVEGGGGGDGAGAFDGERWRGQEGGDVVDERVGVLAEGGGRRALGREMVSALNCKHSRELGSPGPAAEGGRRSSGVEPSSTSPWTFQKVKSQRGPLREGRSLAQLEGGSRTGTYLPRGRDNSPASRRESRKAREGASEKTR